MMQWLRRLLVPAHLEAIGAFDPQAVPRQAILPVVKLFNDLADCSLDAAEFRHRWSEMPLHDDPSLEPLQRIAEEYLHARDSRNDWMGWGGSPRTRMARMDLKIVADALRQQLRQAPRTPTAG